MNINGMNLNPTNGPRSLSSMEMQWLNALPAEMKSQAAQQMMMFRENELVSLMSQQLGQLTGGMGGTGGNAGLSADSFGPPRQLSPEEAEARADRRLAMQMQMQQVSEDAQLRSTLAKIMHDTAMAIIGNMR